jgi:hypothetical protein
MLRTGWYQPAVKARIRGRGGHLSNDEAAELVRRHALHRAKWIALAHLSEVNNHPDVALQTHRAQVGKSYPLAIAGRYGVSDLLQV